MRKLTAIFLPVLLIIIFSGCAKNYTAVYNGTEYTVNTNEKTITDGTNIYRYDFDGTDSHPSVEIIYPDGSVYYSVKQGNSYISGNSDDYGNPAYVDGSVLSDMIFENSSDNSKSRVIPLAVILILLGVLDIIIPEKMWKLNFGWRFKNAEPSELAIVFRRVSGAVIILIAIICIFI